MANEIVFNIFNRVDALDPSVLMEVRKTKRGSFFRQLLTVDFEFSAPTRPIQSTARQSHCRASASRTRVTGNNGKKATSGSGGSDPDPEPRRQPRLSGLFALRNVLTACRTLIAANTYRLEVLA